MNGEPCGDWLDVMMTLPFNIASRCPVLSVPSGRSREGVPTGLSVVGKTYDDVALNDHKSDHRSQPLWSSTVHGGGKQRPDICASQLEGKR